MLDRRTHPFAGKQKISFWKYTFGTVGGQKGVYVCWKFGEIFEVLAHEMMPFFLAYRSRMFASGSRWHFFEWTRRLPSMRMTTQNHVHFGGFGLV